jgi:hypothetical protein
VQVFSRVPTHTTDVIPLYNSEPRTAAAMAEATEENPIVFFDVTLGGASARGPSPRTVFLCTFLGSVCLVHRDEVARDPIMTD